MNKNPYKQQKQHYKRTSKQSNINTQSKNKTALKRFKITEETTRSKTAGILE